MVIIIDYSPEMKALSSFSTWPNRVLYQLACVGEGTNSWSHFPPRPLEVTTAIRIFFFINNWGSWVLTPCSLW